MMMMIMMMMVMMKTNFREYSLFKQTAIKKSREYKTIKKQHRPPFVDDFESFGDYRKRRSLRRVLSPALFHQSKDVWMHFA